MQRYCSNLPSKPGIYSMYNRNNQVIYIGKAKNLKKRVSSYFKSNFHPKIKALVAEICNIEITVTNNEVEALILENKLINQLKPKYNVVFRDDKSYPYIALTLDEYPSIKYIRNKDNKYNKKNYILYGPYPSSYAVKTSISLLAKIFKLRTCSMHVFNNRTMPCLEYQLNRCSAPCVRYISKERYAQDVSNVKLFLENQSKIVIKNLSQEMKIAALNQDYELAAKLRDQINALTLLQNKQVIVNKKAVNLDVLAIAISNKLVCIHVLHIRNGVILYSKQFFSKIINLFLDDNKPEILLERFILQNYSSNVNIKTILTAEVVNSNIIKQATGIKVTHATKGNKLAWQLLAKTNAEEALLAKDKELRIQKNNFKLLQKLLYKQSESKKGTIDRIACFDVSHTAGKETVASCVVFNNLGKEYSSYRLFNIKLAKAGDDYYALKEAITRYLKNIEQQLSAVPDILIIDGGKGQLKIAEEVLAQFEPHLDIFLLSIAKGFKRKLGLEKIYLNSNGKELQLASIHPVFKLLLKIRDEAHRFAVKAHRKKRDQIN